MKKTHQVFIKTKSQKWVVDSEAVVETEVDVGMASVVEIEEISQRRKSRMTNLQNQISKGIRRTWWDTFSKSMRNSAIRVSSKIIWTNFVCTHPFTIKRTLRL